MKEKYMKRLMACSLNELAALEEHIASDRTRRNAQFMLSCVVAAIAAKIGM